MSTSENLRNIGIVLVVSGVLVLIVRVSTTSSLTQADETAASISILLGLILIISSFFVSNNRSKTRELKKIEHTNPLRHRKSLMFIKPKQLKFIKSKSNKKFKLH